MNSQLSRCLCFLFVCFHLSIAFGQNGAISLPCILICLITEATDSSEFKVNPPNDWLFQVSLPSFSFFSSLDSFISSLSSLSSFLSLSFLLQIPYLLLSHMDLDRQRTPDSFLCERQHRTLFPFLSPFSSILFLSALPSRSIGIRSCVLHGSNPFPSSCPHLLTLLLSVNSLLLLIH